MSSVKESITDALRVLLAAGGPFSAVVLRYTDMNESDFNLLTQLVLFVVPPAAAWVWGLYLNSLEKKVAAIAAAPAAAQHAALTKVPDTAKVLIASQVPDVATIVVKDDANGALGTLARLPEHRDIVTASQNELDAKEGERTADQLVKEIRQGYTDP